AEFNAHLRQARAATDRAERLRAVEAALALYRGPFLASETMPWCVAERERLRRRYVRAAAWLADRRARDRDWPAVAAVCEAALRHHPFEEGLHERLLTALLRQDDRPAAIQHFRQYEAQLQADMGVV